MRRSCSGLDQNARKTAQILVTFDPATFDDLQANRLREMELRIESETKRKRRSWVKQIERMREEFLEMRPVDDAVFAARSDVIAMTSSCDDERRNSDEVVDPRGMRTTFLDYPDTGRRFKVRFNLTGFNRKSIAVTTEGGTIVVRASRTDEQENGTTVEREYLRKVGKPPGVDHAKLNSYLTSDNILIVEAPVAPSSLDLSRVFHHSASSGLAHHHSPLTSCHSISPSNHSGSPGTPSGGTGAKEKYGVPIFREEDGRRSMYMVVDIGTAFRPSDILVQVIKENKILVKAKRTEKSADQTSKDKFCKEYELSEKIETHSLRGGLQSDGKLIVSAEVKGHKHNLPRTKSSTGSAELEPRTGKAELGKSGSDGCVANTVVATAVDEELQASGDAIPASHG